MYLSEALRTSILQLLHAPDPADLDWSLFELRKNEVELVRLMTRRRRKFFVINETSALHDFEEPSCISVRVRWL